MYLTWIKLEYCREDSLRIYVRRQARPASWVSLTEAPLTSIWCLRQNIDEFIMTHSLTSCRAVWSALVEAISVPSLLISCLCSRPERLVPCRTITSLWLLCSLCWSFHRPTRPVGKKNHGRKIISEEGGRICMNIATELVFRCCFPVTNS
jgi:hypothetical protein